MTRKTDNTRDGRKFPVVAVALAAVAALGVMWMAYRVFLTIPVTIDGVSTRLDVGTRVADLIADGRLHGRPGNLVAAKDHRVLKVGGGEPGYASIGGKRADASQRLYGSDDVRSTDGSDTIEPLSKRVESIKPPLRYVGTGSLEVVVAEGQPGLREISFGSISKQVSSTHVLREAQARVVRREQPSPDAKVIALTFDDGPWPGQTEQILGILTKYGVKATFFQLGVQARGRPGITKKLADAGMMLANHSQTHPNLARCSSDRVAREMEQAEANIEKASGQHPRYFRPPGGNMSDAVWSELRKMDLKLVMWDIDTTDWRRPSPDVIVSKVLNNVRPGSVVLMHDGGGDRTSTIKALPRMIEGLKARGYQFVTLDGIAKLPQRMG